MTEVTDGAANPSFVIRRFPAIETNLASPPKLPRYSLEQRRLLWMRVVVVLAQVVTLALVLTSKRYSAQTVLAVVVVMIVVLAALEGVIIFIAVNKARQQAALNRDPSRRWQWPGCLYLGPYDDETGIRGSREMFRLYEKQGRAPLVTVMIVDAGFGWAPPESAFATRARPLVSRLAGVDHVDIIEGAAPGSWWTVVRPRDGWRVGQLRIVSKDGRQALFTGINVEHMVARLQAHGGQVHDGSSSGW